MADTHHDPSSREIRIHTIAGTVIGVALLGAAMLVIGNAMGLYTF